MHSQTHTSGLPPAQPVAESAPDLRRFAVVREPGGAIMEVGLSERNAAIYVASFNESMLGTGISAKIVPIVWHLARESAALSATTAGVSLN